MPFLKQVVDFSVASAERGSPGLLNTVWTGYRSGGACDLLELFVDLR